jgi:hypothetical protein
LGSFITLYSQKKDHCRCGVAFHTVLSDTTRPIPKGKTMQEHSKEEIRELQYWATKVKGVSVENAKSLDAHLCSLLGINDPEPIDDPDF